MHPLIPINDLVTLTDADLLVIEARLRDLILSPWLSELDRARCAASLTNAVFVITMRRKPRAP